MRIEDKHFHVALIKEGCPFRVATRRYNSRQAGKANNVRRVAFVCIKATDVD
jgi:hypothetical protein